MPGPPGSLGAGVANRAEGWAQIYRVTCAILDGGEVRERQPRSNWPVSILLWCRSPASHCGNEKTLFLKRYFQLGQLLFIFPLLPPVGSEDCCHQNNNRVRFMKAWLVLFLSTLCLPVDRANPFRCASLWSSPLILTYWLWFHLADRWNQSICLPRPCFLLLKCIFFHISFLSELHPISLLTHVPPRLGQCSQS